MIDQVAMVDLLFPPTWVTQSNWKCSSVLLQHFIVLHNEPSTLGAASALDRYNDTTLSTRFTCRRASLYAPRRPPPIPPRLAKHSCRPRCGATTACSYSLCGRARWPCLSSSRCTSELAPPGQTVGVETHCLVSGSQVVSSSSCMVPSSTLR